MLYLGDAQVNIRIGENGKDNEGGNSTSSGTVVDVSRFYTPKEYEIYFIVNDVPHKLNYSLKNPDNCFMRDDVTHDSNYVILDGKLFKINDATLGMSGLTQVGDSDKWTSITGMSSGTDVAKDVVLCAIGLCDGQLYYIKDVTATLASASKGWKLLTGCAGRKGTSSRADVYYAYAFLDNTSYYCSIDSKNNFTIKKGTASTEEAKLVSGSGYDSWDNCDKQSLCYIGNTVYIMNAAALASGKVMDGVIKITGQAGWINPQAHYGYILTNSGTLYRRGNSGTVQITTPKTGWTDISGYGYHTNYGDNSYNLWPLAINGGKLYYLQDKNTFQIGTDTNWTSVAGHFTSTRSAFGICNNRLYSIKNKTTITDLGLVNPIKVIANNSGINTPTFVICRA
jgi:hypothetical protein